MMVIILFYVFYTSFEKNPKDTIITDVDVNKAKLFVTKKKIGIPGTNNPYSLWDKTIMVIITYKNLDF